MKFKALLLAPFASLMLVGCGGPSNQTVLNKIIQEPTNLLTANGDICYSGAKTRIKSGIVLYGVNKGSFEIDGKVYTPTAEWTFSNEDWQLKEYKVDGQVDESRIILRPKALKVGDPDFSTDITLTMKLGSATATTSYTIEIYKA